MDVRIATVTLTFADPMRTAFGILRLTPRTLRVMDGTFMTQGSGRMFTWKG